MSAGEAITAALSGGAIVIAALSLVLTFVRDRARLMVRVSTVTLPGPSSSGSTIVFDGENKIAFEIQNEGRYREVISTVGIYGRRGEKHWQLATREHFPEGEPPHALEPGDSWHAWVGREIFAGQAEKSSIRPRRVRVTCKSGREYSARFPWWLLPEAMRPGRIRRLVYRRPLGWFFRYP